MKTNYKSKLFFWKENEMLFIFYGKSLLFFSLFANFSLFAEGMHPDWILASLVLACNSPTSLDKNKAIVN